MKNKIVFVAPSLKTGGGTRVFIELANQICDTRSVVILYPYNSNELHTFQVRDEVIFHKVGKYAGSRWAKLLNLYKVIRYLNVHCKEDIIIVSDPFFSVLTFLLNSKKIFRFIQSDDYRLFDDGFVIGKGLLLVLYKKLCLWSYRHRNVAFIFNSFFVYTRFQLDSKRKDIPYKYVHPAINPGIFFKETMSDLVGTKFRICLIARKHPMKGINNFLNVWRDFPVDLKNSVEEVVFISHDDLSDFDTRGIKIVKPSNDRDIANILKGSSVFIFTSWWEGFGLPPLEAMACGCACLISKAGGVDEYARSEVNCLMYTPNDESQLRSQLIRLINNAELRLGLSERAARDARSFVWNNSATQFLNILES